MADAKITDLVELVTVDGADLLAIVDDSAAPKTTKKITVTNLVDPAISANADVTANNAHRTSDGKDHSDVVLNNTHRASTGNPHSATTDDIPAGSTNLYRLPLTFIQYRNAVNQVINNANAILNFGTDFDSILGTNFTKPTAQEFQTNFNGYVELNYSFHAYSDTNQRGLPVWATKNAVEITGTRRSILTANGALRGGTATVSVIVPCAVNDIFRFRADSSAEGIEATFPAGQSSVTIRRVQ